MSTDGEVETHRVIDGRRWRVSDPRIPEEFRQALVDELMAARRAVKVAGADEEAEREARGRVHDAKVALGERGLRWWEVDVDPHGVTDRIVRSGRAIRRARPDLDARSEEAARAGDVVAAVVAITSCPSAQVAAVLAAAPGSSDDGR